MAKKEKVNEPEFYTSAINSTVVNYKVYIMKPREKMLWFVLLLVIGGAVGLVFYGGLFKSEGERTLFTYISDLVIFVGVGLLANKLFMPTVVENRRKKRIGKLKMQFRDFLSTLSTALSSGMNMTDALKNAYDDLCLQYTKDSIIAIEVFELLENVRNNVRIEEAISSLGTRSGIEDISNFSTVFAVAYRTGGNLKEIVKRTADIICDKMIIAEEIESKLTSNKMQLNIMMVIPVVLVLMMKFMSSDFAESFASPVGVVAVTVGVVFFLLAYKIGNKIMDVKG